MPMLTNVKDAWEDAEDLQCPVDGAMETADSAYAYVDGAWEEVWCSVQPIEISTDGHFNGTVTAEGNDISIHFGTDTENSGKVYIDIYGEWNNPIITGTLEFSAGSYSSTYYYHENIRWTVGAYLSSGTGKEYELPNSDGQHAYDYSEEVVLSIPLEGVTHIQIIMDAGTYNDNDVSVNTNLLGLKIDDVPYGADITL